jgi:hypothetical protein
MSLYFFSLGKIKTFYDVFLPTAQRSHPREVEQTINICCQKVCRLKSDLFNQSDKEMRHNKWARRKLQLKEWYFASLDGGEHRNSLLDPLIASGCYAVAQKASMRRANCQMIKQRVYLRKRFHCRRGVKCARRRDKISKFAQHTLWEAARTPKSAPRNLLQMVYVYNVYYTPRGVSMCV